MDGETELEILEAEGFIDQLEREWKESVQK